MIDEVFHWFAEVYIFDRVSFVFLNFIQKGVLIAPDNDTQVLCNLKPVSPLPLPDAYPILVACTQSPMRTR